MQVGLVGTGPKFAAIVHLLDRSGARIHHWRPEGADEEPTAGLPASVREVGLDELGETPLIFLCLPVSGLREVARRLGAVMSGRHVLVHTTRNLEPDTVQPVSAILTEETPTLRVGYVTGPFLEADVLADRPSSAVCASSFPEVHQLAEDALHSATFRLYRADDMKGAEHAAAFGRILAMVAGFVRAMDLGPSLAATQFARGLAELARFVVYRGGYERTAFGLAGCGNLHADATDPGSDDFQIGLQFGRDPEISPDDIRAEFGVVGSGLFSLLDALSRELDLSRLDLPMFENAVAVIRGECTPQEALERLMKRPADHE